ncbi:MAG TPA: lysophospholipid acyltransferase family protein, partial [Anaerolineales bacterium]
MAAEYRPPAYTVVTRPLMRGVVGVIFHLLGRIRVTGKENIPLRQPYIVALNHVSIIDPPAVLTFWPEIIEAIGAIDVFDKPVQGQMLRMYGTIPVHRGEYDRALIDKMLSLLRQGRPVMIAPEGGRSHVPGLRRAMPGV